MKQECGRSMIEMLGVLTIMGIITVGATLLISRAMDLQRRNTINDEVVQIVTNVRTMHAEYDDFSNINSQIILGAMGQKNLNTYGVSYEITTDAANSRQFIVTVKNLSESDCKFLLAKAWRDSVGFRLSDGKEGGATGKCDQGTGKNFIRITYGE